MANGILNRISVIFIWNGNPNVTYDVTGLPQALFCFLFCSRAKYLSPWNGFSQYQSAVVTIVEHQIDVERNSMQRIFELRHFVLNSHLDQIGDQNDVQYLTLYYVYLAYTWFYTYLRCYVPTYVRYCARNSFCHNTLFLIPS